MCSHRRNTGNIEKINGLLSMYMHQCDISHALQSTLTYSHSDWDMAIHANVPFHIYTHLLASSSYNIHLYNVMYYEESSAVFNGVHAYIVI